MRDAWRSIRLLMRISWQLDRASVIWSFLEALGRLLQSLNPAMVGLLVTGIARHNATLLFAGAVGIVAAQGVSQLFMLTGVQARLNATDIIRHDFDARLARALSTTPTLAIHLDPDEQDTVQALRDRMGSLGFAFNTLVNVINNLVSPITTLAVAAGADLRLLLLVPVAMLVAYSTRWTMRWDAAAERDSAAPGRLSAHLTDLILGATSAGELRVLGARNWIRGRLREQVRVWRSPFVRAGWRTTALESAMSLLYVAAAVAILAWLVRDCLHGHLSPGRVATAALVAGELRDSVDSGSWAINGLSSTLRTVQRYRRLDAYAARERRAHPGTVDAPDVLTTGVGLHGASFAYPGAGHDTLHEVDLHLPAGSTVAIVGENGAGKSSLVGVLTGMYDLHSGSVTIDGRDLREFDLTSWRERCSGAFQDHAQLELTAREAICAGDPHRIPDDATALEALDRASASDILHALPDGLDTQLGTQWPGGVGLSGGQWQRLAIARGMVRRHPLLLVLDEPTSALDPATEHTLFEHYAAAARDTQERGGVTLLVTHRFSTVSAADLVVVLDGGRVVEQGTHDELLAARGRYAQLYELQAAGYR